MAARKGRPGTARQHAPGATHAGKAAPAAPSRTFVLPPAKPKPVAREPKAGRAARTFVESPTVPTLKEVLLGSAPGEGYGLPPREVCDECGARPMQQHASDCSYAGYPTLIQDPDFRPSLAAELKLSKVRCSVCRCPVIFEIEYDRTQHKWWCTWWDAHPDVPPPF